MATKEEIRERILDAADKRFGYFGYNKTTMAEIAADCSMSAANLYRYFKDKSAIGAFIAKRYFDKEYGLIREKAEDPGLTPEEKLLEIVLVSIRYNFTEFEDCPAVMELVDHICKDGIELIEDHRKEVLAVVVKILDEGNRTNAFLVKDLEETAVAIRFATIPFHATPVFLMLKSMGRSKEEMEALAATVIRLLVEGIKR